MAIKIEEEEKPTIERSEPKPFDFGMECRVEQMDLLSVGVDIGSSTSHLISSKLKLEREPGFLNMTNRFDIIERDILYEGQIINTPLLDRERIDIEKVVSFCKEEYKNTGYDQEEVNTGAVIVTVRLQRKPMQLKLLEGYQVKPVNLLVQPQDLILNLYSPQWEVVQQPDLKKNKIPFLVLI